MERKILVVDDEKDIINVLYETLTGEGFNVDSAANVEEAVKKIDANEYDIVITDKNLPGPGNNREGGLDILKYVKKNSPLTGVIMITGYATVESVIEAMKHGAFDYLQKPFKIQELIDKTSRLAEYQAFINPENTTPIYEAFHKGLLNLFIEKEKLDEEEKRKLLESYQNIIDMYFKALKEREQVILQQRDALSNIEGLAQMIKETMQESDPLFEMIEKICRETQNRI